MDALSATGLRSIRYALECRSGSPLPVEIIANDISKPAIATIKENAAANGVEEAIIVNEDDARCVFIFTFFIAFCVYHC